jgi:hypothetical protein
MVPGAFFVAVFTDPEYKRGSRNDRMVQQIRGRGFKGAFLLPPGADRCRGPFQAGKIWGKCSI